MLEFGRREKDWLEERKGCWIDLRAYRRSAEVRFCSCIEDNEGGNVKGEEKERGYIGNRKERKVLPYFHYGGFVSVRCVRCVIGEVG